MDLQGPHVELSHEEWLTWGLGAGVGWGAQSYPARSHVTARLALPHLVIGNPRSLPTHALPISGPATPPLSWKMRQMGHVVELWKARDGAFQAHGQLLSHWAPGARRLWYQHLQQGL